MSGVTATDADEETGQGLNAFCNPVASFQSYPEASLATMMLQPKRISSMEFEKQLNHGISIYNCYFATTIT
jgi:hypothetical protein